MSAQVEKSSTSNNKKIAKNTAYMYIRMLFTMVVSLYTSRIVLQTLGEVDFGTYSIVGGIVILFTFISNAMATGTQRHLSYELGKEKGDVPTIFTACFRIHFWLAIIIFLLAETVGLWFLNYKMNFPEGRMTIVNWIYQFSLFSCIVGVVQTPFNAAIISYEKMSFYAYLSIVDVLMKLGVVFILLLLPWDKLLLYAALLLAVHFLMFVVYAVYSFKKLEGIRLVTINEKGLYKKLITFSGWSLFGSLANVGYQQGINIIINLFFGVALNAATGIANQINGAVSQFVAGFQQALNPQLVQSEASNDRSRQLDLIYKSSKFSFYIIFIIAFPLIVNLNYVLTLWLGKYPSHTEALSILILIGLLISCLSGPLWVSIYATGNIKYYQLSVSIVALSILPIAYIIGKFGGSPEVIYAVRASNFIFVLIVQLFFLKKYISMDIKGFISSVILPACLIMILTIGCYYILHQIMNPADSFIALVYQTIIYIIMIGSLVWLLGLTKTEKQQLTTLVINRLHKK